MADNIVLNAGAGGATLATDDDGVAQHQYVKVEFGADNTFTKVTSAVGLPTDVLDRAARDLGKVDVASLDQYTPTDVDTGAGTDNALPVALRLPASGGGVTAPGDATNGLDVDVTRVSGNVTVVQATATNLKVDASDVAVPVTDNGGSLTVDGTVTATVAGGTVKGTVAHDAADADAPVKTGGKATTALSGVTLVANNDVTDAYHGVDGVQIVRPHCNLEDIVSGNASNSDGTSTQVIAAGGAGVKQYLTSTVLTNTSASNIYVELKSGATVKATIPLPANSGAIFNPPVPLPPNAANEAWNFDPSAAATTVYCTMIAFKSKV